MRTKLPPKERLSVLVGVRLKPAEYQSLKVEAEENGLDVTSFMRMLVATHPRRNRKGGRKGK